MTQLPRVVENELNVKLAAGVSTRRTDGALAEPTFRTSIV
jgi:hypothetical protein